ncbi:MAG: ATP-binding protein [Promethearchaeota archaeon]
MEKKKRKKTWKVTVDRSIYERLSRGTYDTLAKGLKELISNSYDCDALSLEIVIEDDKSKIHLYDDGKGMTEEDFDNFVRLGGRHKRLKNKAKRDIDKDTTELGRKKIGWMGIGNLAISEYCDLMEVWSTTKGNVSVLHALVDCREYFQPGEATDIEVVGDIYDDEDEINEQYTRITLHLFDRGKRQLEGSLDTDLDRDPQKMAKNEKMSNLTRFKWELERICPLLYRDDDKEFKILEDTNVQPIKVTLNGRELRRAVIRNLNFDVIKNKGYEHYREGGLDMSYKIGWNKRIIPTEARGILTRVKNVAIGTPFDFGVSTLSKHIYRPLDWISGEVIIHEGLDDDLDTSREKFQRRTQEFQNYYKRMQQIIEEIAKTLEDIGEYDAKIKKINQKLIAGRKKIAKEEKAINEVSKKYRTKIAVPDLERDCAVDTHPILPVIPKKTGYNIIQKQEKGAKPIEVNHTTKEIHINLENESLTKDSITIMGDKYFLKPSEWSYQQNDPEGFCKFRKRKKVKLILLNRKHPLFNTKDYKLFIWLKYAQLVSKNDAAKMMAIFQDLYLALS